MTTMTMLAITPATATSTAAVTASCSAHIEPDARLEPKHDEQAHVPAPRFDAQVQRQNGQ